MGGLGEEEEEKKGLWKGDARIIAPAMATGNVPCTHYDTGRRNAALIYFLSM